MRKYIIGYLGRVLCLREECPAYCLEDEEDLRLDEQLSELRKSKQPVKKSQESFLENQSKSSGGLCCACTCLKDYKTPTREKKLIRLNTDNNKDATIASNSNVAITYENESPLPETKKRNAEPSGLIDPTEAKSLYQKLENLIIKLQISFDPFALRNNKLKNLLLEEIIECESNLLAIAHASKNTSKKRNDDKQTQSELAIKKLYDEWKILAMVIDRLCFFVYFFCLVLSSGLFYISERKNII